MNFILLYNPQTFKNEFYFSQLIFPFNYKPFLSSLFLFFFFFFFFFLVFCIRNKTPPSPVTACVTKLKRYLFHNISLCILWHLRTHSCSSRNARHTFRCFDKASWCMETKKVRRWTPNNVQLHKVVLSGVFWPPRTKLLQSLQTFSTFPCLRQFYRLDQHSKTTLCFKGY